MAEKIEDYPRLKALTVSVRFAGTEYVLSAELHAKLGREKSAVFSRLFGVQTCPSIENVGGCLYPWDAEAVLERMASGHLQGRSFAGTDDEGAHRGLIPPGGYHFLDRSGGAEVRIDGGSFADVAKNVLSHRLRNSKPPGNPLQELYDYVCGNWGHICRETSPQAPEGPEPLSSRMLVWLAQFQATAGVDAGVEQQEANKRASICAGCPRNVQYYGCTTCGEHIRSQTFIYLHNRTTPDSERLHACDALAEPLKLTVFSRKLPKITADVPEFCWRKAI